MHIDPKARGWVGVVSHAHVRRGVAGGFAQLCHGKHGPLARMERGDYLVYYSPSTEFGGGEPLRAFTAIGRVVGDAPYLFDMGGGFVPYRRDVAYFDAELVTLASLRASLEFARGSWGMLARRGHFPIALDDVRRIANAMKVTDPSKSLRTLEQMVPRRRDATPRAAELTRVHKSTSAIARQTA